MNKFDPDTLKAYIHDGGFFVEKHPSANLFIYGYSNNHNIKWDEQNKHLRGLILDDNGIVKARSFPKFFSYRSYLSQNKILLSNNQILDLPSTDFQIFEKLDGTLGVLYWIKNKPFIASQRSFTSKKALIATELLYQNYKHSIDLFKRDRTYLFEVISPETKVIVNYKKKRELYLIGILDNETGTQLPLEDVGIPMVKNYTSDFSFVKNFKDLQNLNIPEMEGFVIVFNNGIRFKIKFPWYSEVHKLLDQLMFLDRTKYNICQKLKTHLNIDFKYISNADVYNCLNEENSLDSILKNVPAIYYYYGFEEWLIKIVNKYNFQKNRINNGEIKSQDLKKLTPDYEEIFTVNRNQIIDSAMLNLYNRIESTYD